eukprot:TRINITY_DN106_c0_g1_i9.p1 TRINITY_DN106_c0_g1~~TRINITY_DN106_c0_g1_i9.p1  ORF type:complete len:646 (+),score=124.90 TRINITY_DN106_c0_g1_i9:54-1940(+)
MTIANEPDRDDDLVALEIPTSPKSGSPKSPKSPKSRSLEASFASEKTISKKKRMHLQWESLSFSVKVEDEKKPKQILHKISSELRPGELTAIMGPSGAGKSTLLNVLAGRSPYGTAEGKISLNGKVTEPSMYRNRLAYVMQHDALFAMQTPNEVLYFTASLRYPNMSEEDRRALVASAIEQLGLERCQDTLIGSDLAPGLSGGEKKRTAVAVELISNPSLIFLDEPTSGLDSYSAFELVKILRRLADNGCSIICTIHQPSSEVFEMFSRVILLRKGVLAYDGKVTNLVQHFAEAGFKSEQKNFNPADYVMMKMQTLTDDEMAPLIKAVTPRKVKSSIGGSTKEVVVKLPPFFTQVRHLFARECQQFVRDTMTLRARLGMALGLATLVGLIFLQNGKEWGEDGNAEDIFFAIADHRAGIVFMGINALFLASQPMLIAFPVERPVFLREHVAGTYSARAYMLAKTMIDVPACIVQACITVGIIYGLVGLNAFVLYLFGTIALLCVVSSSTAILLGSAVTRAETAISLSPVTVMPQLLFSGILIAAENIPIWIRWLQWSAPLKYAVNLGLIAEFHDSAVPDDRQLESNNLLFKNEIGRDSWWWYTVILVAMFFSFRIIAAFILSQRAQNFA